MDAISFSSLKEQQHKRLLSLILYIIMAIQEGPDGFKEKGVKLNWPVEDGIVGGTTTQEGHVMNLVPEKSFVSEKDKVGL